MPEPSGQNPTPEIPSFKSTQGGKEEKKGSGAPLPGAGPLSKLPSLRLRGPGGAATTVIERLKQLKKKDLIFIASGLSLLLTAPLFEHFMLGPGQEAGVLRQGFDQKGGAFTEANPYEPSAGLAPGGLPGQGNEVITPLNVRDPASLILGPGAAQQPPAPTAGAGEAAAKPEDWKNALAQAAKGGAAAAAGGGLPSARGALAGALRGLSALSGATSGGGPNAGLPPISAANVPNRGGGRNFVQVAAAPGYGGVASRGTGQGTGSSIEALKSAAEKAGNMFPRTGSPSENLRAAAATAIPGGGLGTGAGGPGAGSAYQNPTGTTSKESKSIGESLAFLRAKMIQEKEIDLFYRKKAWLEFERAQEIQKELIKLLIDKMVGDALLAPISNRIAKQMKSLFGGAFQKHCVLFEADGDPHSSDYWPAKYDRAYPMESWDQIDEAGQNKSDSAQIDQENAREIARWIRLTKSKGADGQPKAQCWDVSAGGGIKASAAPKGGGEGEKNVAPAPGDLGPIGQIADKTRQNLDDIHSRLAAFKEDSCKNNADCNGVLTKLMSADEEMRGVAFRLQTIGAGLNDAKTLMTGDNGEAPILSSIADSIQQSGQNLQGVANAGRKAEEAFGRDDYKEAKKWLNDGSNAQSAAALFKAAATGSSQGSYEYANNLFGSQFRKADSQNAIVNKANGQLTNVKGLIDAAQKSMQTAQEYINGAKTAVKEKWWPGPLAENLEIAQKGLDGQLGSIQKSLENLQKYQNQLVAASSKVGEILDRELKPAVADNSPLWNIAQTQVDKDKGADAVSRPGMTRITDPVGDMQSQVDAGKPPLDSMLQDIAPQQTNISAIKGNVDMGKPAPAAGSAGPGP